MLFEPPDICFLPSVYTSLPVFSLHAAYWAFPSHLEPVNGEEARNSDNTCTEFLKILCPIGASILDDNLHACIIHLMPLWSHQQQVTCCSNQTRLQGPDADARPAEKCSRNWCQLLGCWMICSQLQCHSNERQLRCCHRVYSLD